jgi:hypothetical protein
MCENVSHGDMPEIGKRFYVTAAGLLVKRKPHSIIAAIRDKNTPSGKRLLKRSYARRGVSDYVS